MPEAWKEVCGMRGQQFGKETNDCTVIALAKVVGIEYEASHRILEDAGRKDGQGISVWNLIRHLAKNEQYGFRFKEVFPKPSYLKTLKQTARKFEGKYLVTVRCGMSSGHAIAILDGIITDSIVDHLPITGMWQLVEKGES